MNEALFESFAKELTALVARDEAGRGASKLSSPRELMRAASAFDPLRKLAVVSGFLRPSSRRAGDGRPRRRGDTCAGLQREGRECEIWTDARCIEVIAECAKAAGCAENTARIAPASLKERAPDGIIFVERLGRAADGRYYNFKKQDISEWTASLDALADEGGGPGNSYYRHRRRRQRGRDGKFLRRTLRSAARLRGVPLRRARGVRADRGREQLGAPTLSLRRSRSSGASGAA